jgi:nucleoside-diphosphate-sugar epimerase
VWFAPHAPAVTQREMVAAACRHLGLPPRIRVSSPLMMRLAGLFIVGARESVEMLYQYTAPWVVSSAAIESAFGLTPTPIEEGLKRTGEWWKEGAR